MKELPIGDIAFPDIIDKDLLYADNTKYIYELIRAPGPQYFLSRPRRFGKTLFLDTLR